MKIPPSDLPEELSAQERFLRIARRVVTTTPEQLAEREAAEQEARRVRGLKRPGPPKGTAPRHKAKREASV